MTETILITLCTLNLLALAGLAWMAKTKLVPALNSLQALSGPKHLTIPEGALTPADAERFREAGREKTVILLTPEHDAKVLGDESEG